MNHELNIILPVRTAKNAKNRLSTLLSSQQRRELSTLLFNQSLDFYRSQWPKIQLTIITDSYQFKKKGEEAGACVLTDPGSGLNNAVEFATRYSLQKGFSRQLIVHSDIAILDREDIAQLVDCKLSCPGILGVPATADGGTNALLEQPPGIIEHYYGRDSFEKHKQAALRSGVELDVLELSGLGLDLDTEEDIYNYLKKDPNGMIAKKLNFWGVISLAS